MTDIAKILRQSRAYVTMSPTDGAKGPQDLTRSGATTATEQSAVIHNSVGAPVAHQVYCARKEYHRFSRY